MARQYSLPFQVLATLRVAALVLTLTAIFLWFVLGRVHEQIEQSGRENFHVFASSAFGELDELTQSHLRYLYTLGQLLPLFTDLYSEKATNALAQTFLKQPGHNALTVTQENDDMLYFLRHDIEAPPGTAYTMGQLRVQANGKRLIFASYHTANGSVLKRRTIPIDLYPSKTEWYQNAMHLNGPYASTPHPIPGRNTLALTLAIRFQNSVVALTTPLDLLDRLLQRVPVSTNGAVVLIDDQQRVVAIRSQGSQWPALNIDHVRLEPLVHLGNPILTDAAIAIDRLAEDESSLVTLGNEPYLFAWHTMTKVSGTHYRMLLLSPLSDMSQAATGARRDVWLLTLAALVILLPMTWWGTGEMARVLQRLVQNSQRIGRLDFETQEFPVHSSVREIRALGLAHESMRNALAGRTQALERVSRHLEQLIGIGVILTDKKDPKDLLNAILGAAREITNAEFAILFLRDDNDILQPLATMGLNTGYIVQPVDLKLPNVQRETLAAHTVLSGATCVVDGSDTDIREELTAWRHHREALGFHGQTAVSLPLHTPDRRVIGVMVVFNATHPDTREPAPFSPQQVSYLEALAAQTAVALENQKLITSQSNLLDALVRTLGDAVDAKSAYTGRHCARVPELAMMLAQEAHAADHGPLTGFEFRSEDEWREFRTGAWLHDCGKITSPEHVMDKATKLETVYNRLHEIRTRFEVLLRDARIETLQSQIDGHMDVATAEAEYAQRTQTLREQYADLARCNVGSEKMTAEDVARVRTIGQQTWMRHFDDRLGLSHEELARHHEPIELVLPAAEPLLADKPWQVIKRTEKEKHELTEGFRMQVPEHLYNHGELYNLCIERGTLNPEERFKINEHIIHTIRMLEGAQFPSHLRRVPEYAGTHHEAMDGSGYPRGLTAAELSIPSRIMAIADIFEALTAADRPYKAAKTLSESITILHRMKVNGHIDPDLFDLFLSKGVHLRYAQRFLAPEQIDMPDITPYLN